MNIHNTHLLKDRPRIDPLGCISFLAGLTSAIQIKFFGQLYLGEVFLAVLGLLLIADKFIPSARSRRKNILENPFFIKFLIALCISFLGLALSDFWVNSVPRDYFRGWAKIIFLTLDVIAIGFAIERNRWNLWWLSVGLGFSILSPSIISHNLLTDWKVVYAGPVAFLVLSFMPWLGKQLLPLTLASAGIVNIVLDYRSLGLMFVIMAAIVWSKVNASQVSRKQLFKLVVALSLSFLLLFAAYQNSQEEFSERREYSNAARFGGIQVAFEAIADSPILGYGSWAKSEALTERFLDLTGVRQRGFNTPDRVYAEQNIPAHSQLLQSWIEGGILGTTFFFFYGIQLVKSLRFLIAQRIYDRLFPLILFSCLSGLWHLVASPFAGSHRFTVALTVGIVCLLHSEQFKTTLAGYKIT
ncbi:O-antigen ligase family protein [Altericista sp. CCNU0014]|uniref:O-antigen ligase family protein n=1 Tax=Altericista sp. CCNU0014 TaxID=3082949 RepID=UPI00384B80D3